MRRQRLYFVAMLLGLASVMLALTVVAHAQQPSASKDAKDFRIEILSMQRNEAQDRLSFCYSENSITVTRLQDENARLKTELDTAKKAAAPAAPAAPPTTPKD